jgi:hypothetical protein
MAALRVDVGQLNRLAQPIGANTVRVVVTSAGHAETVEPPAITAKELAHQIIISTIKHITI